MNVLPPSRPLSAGFVLLGCASVAVAHFAALYTSGLDPIGSSVAALSQGPDGYLHGLGLGMFAMAQVALAFLLERPGAGWPTRFAQGVLVLNAVLVLYIARRFAVDPDALLVTGEPHFSLVLLASSTGIAMAAAAPGLLGSRRRAGVWDLACLFLWLALVPGLSAVEASWLGAYERLVGAVFIIWMVGLAVLIGFAGERHPTPKRELSGEKGVTGTLDRRVVAVGSPKDEP